MNRIRLAITLLLIWAYLCTSLSATPIRIMPWGDSITGEENGYRVRLWKKLIDDPRNLSFQFVGVSTDDQGDVPVAFEPQFYHSGYAMETIADQYDHIADFPELKPEVILLMIGTNDMPKSDASTAHTRLSTLIDKTYQAMPTVKVILLATICPRREYNSNVIAYNAKIPAIIAEKVALGKKIILVDINKSIALENIPDGVHPDGDGYEKLAQTWYQSLAPVLAGMNSPTSTLSISKKTTPNVTQGRLLTITHEKQSLYTLQYFTLTGRSTAFLNVKQLRPMVSEINRTSR